jgi:hypothetical protein
MYVVCIQRATKSGSIVGVVCAQSHMVACLQNNQSALDTSAQVAYRTRCVPRQSLHSPSVTTRHQEALHTTVESALLHSRPGERAACPVSVSSLLGRRAMTINENLASGPSESAGTAHSSFSPVDTKPCLQRYWSSSCRALTLLQI